MDSKHPGYDPDRGNIFVADITERVGLNITRGEQIFFLHNVRNFKKIEEPCLVCHECGLFNAVIFSI